MEQIKSRILLAEDDENLGTLLKNYLIARDYDAELFGNGQSAYRSFKQTTYDLCILDIMMPIKDGFTLAKEIRAENMDIPIIFLTAKTMKEDVLEGFEIGADDYVTKPFNIEELIFRIEAILRRTRGDQIPGQETFTLGRYSFDSKR